MVADVTEHGGVCDVVVANVVSDAGVPVEVDGRFDVCFEPVEFSGVLPAVDSDFYDVHTARRGGGFDVDHRPRVLCRCRRCCHGC